MVEEIKNDLSWKIIDSYFRDNPENLVMHHLESYNNFFDDGIYRIFKENNPIRFIERENDVVNGKANECMLYLGGKTGTRIYLGKPIIYDDSFTHYLYPNDARLRNMTYGITIHYDVDVDFIYYVDGEKQLHSITLSKILLGKFPIMVQSNLCILKGLNPEMRYNMGECLNDFGGYFIIDGMEKVIISQEKFADNMIYVRKNDGDTDLYNYTCEIRSVSEDTSKPTRKTGVYMVAPTTTMKNGQIVVNVPNVRKPIPLFIVMRALGVISDKEIIQTCLLDLDKNKSLVPFFNACVHDASVIFTQENAIKYIASFTKRATVMSVMEILTDYFLPHIGELNFLDKAYFVGYMVYRMLKVVTNQELPTDRDNFQFKRVELSGVMIYDLFREYYLIQKRHIALQIDKEYYYHKGEYKDGAGEDTPNLSKSKREENRYAGNFVSLIESNFKTFFKERLVEDGFKKGFKGNWGSQAFTKRLGVVQDINRLSWNTFISHLRKLNLPLDATAKVVGPRLLNSSQWGLIDPVDTPDGGNIGLHKHLSLSTYITSSVSGIPMIKWLRENIQMKLKLECSKEYLFKHTKVFVNGNWVGMTDTPIESVKIMKLYRKNGIIPVFTSIVFKYSKNEIYIYTDSGRLLRPIYYIDDGTLSFVRKNKELQSKIINDPLSWSAILTGFKEKGDPEFSYKANKLYVYAHQLYPDLEGKTVTEIYNDLNNHKSLVEYMDTSEAESSLIAMFPENITPRHTNLELEPSLMFGVMGNQIIYPEHNPFPRDVFSCGQSKQAVSVYNTNYQMRFDKMSVVLEYAQTPIIKSRYLEYINHEQQPYGVNAIVAIMSFTGYNVEDAILVNQGAIDRGLFRTTYFTTYKSHEESSKVSKTTINSKFANIEKNNVIGLKAGYDYSHLNSAGIIKENTELNDKIVLIGKMVSSADNKDIWIDDSVKPKKGQLGIVDKTFVTEGEEGFNLAKVRIREERIPALGDKMASRAGQKGTIGLIIPENDMPYSKSGLRPDLIINPHAIPSRMTIGQLIECLFGKLCLQEGTFGDCTAYQIKGANYSTYAPILAQHGLHSTGLDVLYNGRTGEQLQSDIFIGPTYYMRLKHMVKDKINYRARGPNTALTRQPVQGRANDGGLRVGEMERDSLIAHGMTNFIQDSFLERGDKYYMAVCNKSGTIAVYNQNKNIFLSPFVDGPLQFNTTATGSLALNVVSKHGRSFSIVKIPYALKLFIQELEIMNIQMKIITDDNINQLDNFVYANSLAKSLNLPEDTTFAMAVEKYAMKMKRRYESQKDEVVETFADSSIRPKEIHVPIEHLEPELEFDKIENPTSETTDTSFSDFSFSLPQETTALPTHDAILDVAKDADDPNTDIDTNSGDTKTIIYNDEHVK